MQYRFLWILFFCGLLVPETSGQLSVSKIFSNNAVLQRDLAVPVWGTANPGTLVSVSLDSMIQQARADEQGSWKIKLPIMSAGGPHLLTVSTESEKAVFENILFGDVWLCSGQSNMEWTVANSANPEEEIARADHPSIRHFKVPLTYSFSPQDTLAGGTWQVCTPENTGAFTAVGYYFARSIRTHHDVPIGLLNSSWGGSRIEPWMSAEALGYKSLEVSATKIKRQIDSIKNAKTEALKQLIGDLPTEDRGMRESFPLWASSDYDHNNWKQMELPTLWEAEGYDHLDGTVWFRKNIYLTQVEAERDLVLSLGMIDDSDVTYINGRQVGAMAWAYNKIRNYTVPAEMLKEGINVLAVRVFDGGGGGGIYGKCENLYYQTSKGTTSLCGDWHFNVGQVLLDHNTNVNQYPTLLYNQMIHPLLDFPIKGVIWYQGESNASMEDAANYHQQFETLITSWRSLWKLGEFPFLWVQLANFMKAQAQPTDTGWARLREAQSKTLTLPNTYEAVIIDIGEAQDIHPKNKQDVGKRLALGVRKLVYGDTSLVFSGPRFQSMQVEGNAIRLHFNLFGSQLTTKNGESPKAFTIAGGDGEFYWAKARVEENQVIVWSDQVPNPVAVRYAWADNPDTINLINTEGLPAAPFRTDTWD